jgi:hypothetical protein
MPTPLAASRRTAVVLFFAVALSYLSLAPGSVAGQGYVDEELKSGTRMLEVFNSWSEGRPIPPMLWSRHGPVPVFLDLPFIELGKTLLSSEFVLSLEPALSTALIITILFVWLRKLCSPSVSLLLALTAAFGTMLWPYAYIGLETKQSLFVMLAAYMGLANGRMVGSARLIPFAVLCGLAMTVKSTGIVLLPAFAYLVYVQFREDWRTRIGQLAAVILTVCALLGFGWWSRKFYWDPFGGAVSGFRHYMVTSVFQVLPNAIALFGSPTKGLLVYAPIVLVALFSIHRALGRHRDLTVFVVILISCVVSFLSILTYGSDEVWGPRYMHSTVVPLILCIGAAWPSFEWRRHGAAVVLACVGVVFSFLGSFFFYSVQDSAMRKAGQNTMEWITGDNAWNDVAFHARLFSVWLTAKDGPQMWTPAPVWVWERPTDAQTWRTIDLREFCEPQSMLLRLWNVPLSGTARASFRLVEFSGVAGPLFLLWTVVRTIRSHRSEFRPDLPGVELVSQ